MNTRPRGVPTRRSLVTTVAPLVSELCMSLRLLSMELRDQVSHPADARLRPNSTTDRSAAPNNGMPGEYFPSRGGSRARGLRGGGPPAALWARGGPPPPPNPVAPPTGTPPPPPTPH